MRFILICTALLAICLKSAHAADVLVSDQAQLITALGDAHPGDNIILRNGIWTDLNIGTQTINGTPAAPINIHAQTPGQVAIAGPGYVFGLAGSNYTVSGLTFKDENDQLKSIRFRGTHVRVFDNSFLMGGRYNQMMWDVQDSAVNPTSSLDHNFFAGKQDRGTLLVLDGALYPQIRNNYFGNRPESGPSGHTNGWETIRIGNSNISSQIIGANIENNYFEGAEGEYETISDKTQNNRIAGNTFRNISQGWVTARLGGGGVYENNQFFNTWGIRVGNADDTIADHPGLVIQNNYLEGVNDKIVLPGYQTQATISKNTVYVGAGAFISTEHTTGKYPLEYNNTTSGTLNGNLFVINDASFGAVQARVLGGINPSGVGSNNLAYNLASGTNIFASGTPANIQSLFTVANPNLARDAYGIYRPNSSGPGAGLGYTGTQTALARNSFDLGPSWLSPAMRLNKMTVGEFQFNGDFSSGSFTSVANNGGYLATPAIMQDSTGTPTNFHSADALGVSGLAGDRAFDNRATASMGAAGGRAQVADRTWFRDLQAFTLAGWFKTDGAQTIGNNASLVEQADANGGWSLRSTAAGKLTLSIGDGSTTKTATSPTSYNQQNQWVFFAVTFDKRPSSNEVSFYIGTDTSNVALAGQASISSSNTSDTVALPVTIGSGFDGLLDNIRIFGSRRNITWIDEDGASYVNTDVNNFTYGLLNLQELRALRAYDLRLPIGDMNGDREVNATDIDLVLRNPGNSLYDIDGDLDTDRADADMLIRQILQSDYGDANLDHAIDTLDFNSLAANFGQSNRGWAQGDFTGDGVVDTTDFNLLASNFGKSFLADGAGPFANVFVPEPTSIALLVLIVAFPTAFRSRSRATTLVKSFRYR
jgi:chondroitinase B-like protein/concanavalin A-like lectin/glucanase superfamily protein